MSITTDLTLDHLTRAKLYSTELKEALQDTLMAQNYVRWLDGFPDGSQFVIPSIGTLESQDYSENEAVQYQALDTGEWTFTINEYVQSGIYITEKAKQDSFYASELVAGFVPKMQRALQERLEADIFKQGQPMTGNPAGSQVAGDPNSINGAQHRWVGSGTLNSKHVLDVTDFAKASYSLKKANVPDTNLIAIVDPANEYYLNTLTNITNVSNNPRWEGVITTGLGSGMRFVKNIYGFDVYTSNRLPLAGADQTGASETINSVASATGSVANLFFSAAPDILPYVGAWRQMPKVDSEYNKDYQREEYVVTSRYGLKIYRPENFISVLTDPTAVFG